MLAKVLRGRRSFIGAQPYRFDVMMVVMDVQVERAAAAAITPRGICGRLLEAALDGRW